MPEKRTTFEQTAEIYDEVRPHYPKQLFEDLLALSNISSRARILEIGTGTGIATLPLAKLGYQITALELGKELAKVASQKLASFNNVDVLVGAFEDWELPKESFDMVMSATAFHWLDKNIRYQKSAAALREGGALAIFRYVHIAGGDRDFFDQSQKCYQNYVPGTDPNFHLPEANDYKSEYMDELKESGQFCQAQSRTYIFEECYAREQYIKLLLTDSNILSLDGSVREKLLDCIAFLIDENFNGQIRKSYLAELIVAKKRVVIQ